MYVVDEDTNALRRRVYRYVLLGFTTEAVVITDDTTRPTWVLIVLFVHQRIVKK